MPRKELLQTMKVPLRALWVLCVALGICSPAAVFAQQYNPCGPLKIGDHYGPYDYRYERTGKLRIVESSHFTPQVEALIRGVSGYIKDELAYVLKASPNHHRALVATIRYAERLKTPWIKDMDFSVECWLERAVRFAPDDTVARSLYAQYLGTIKKAPEGIAILDAGLKYTDDNPLSVSNFGLIYLELGDPERALKQAHRAIELGDTRPKLVELLKSAGKWREPAQ